MLRVCLYASRLSLCFAFLSRARLETQTHRLKTETRSRANLRELITAKIERVFNLSFIERRETSP
ncbi:MAG TPA: hypothetical protein EYP59_13985 [Thiotrichaceae bacterium]|nr:hypothetical protein [Thiotrichaceae bacterium]